MAGFQTILIDRGDLPSLAAAGLETDRSRLVLWHPSEPDRAEPLRLAAVQRHAAALGVAKVIVADIMRLGLPDIAPPPAFVRSHILFCGAMVAAELECTRLVWPVVVGEDADAAAAEVERAHLVESALALGTDSHALAIDLPLVDLSDRKVAEIAEDAGLPLDRCWPCDKAGLMPCRDCRSCRRWQAAFEAAGLLWPWKAIAA